MKYVAIASGAINLALAFVLFLTMSSLQSTKVKLGKAEAVASSNKQVADNARSLYRQCDADRVQIVKDNNAAVSRMVEVAAQQQIAATKAVQRSVSSIARLEDGLSSLGSTPVGGSCEARLLNISNQLEAYRKVALDAQ